MAGNQRVDVAIVGAGVVGLATALGLARAAGPRPVVMVCDPLLAAASREGTLRAVAIAPASRRFLDRLGVWAAVERSAQPMTAMVLTDSRAGAIPAPELLRFPAPGASDEPLAHMVLQEALREALLAGCAEAGVALRAWPVAAIDAGVAACRIEGPDGTVTARLVVAADGGRSKVREWSGIGTVGWDYDQAAIVATVAHDRGHAGEAVQHFLPGGPLALLPMRAPDGSDRRSSIVWTEHRDTVARLMALAPEAFCAALSAAGAFERGALRLEDAPAAHPLRLRVARSLHGRRLALVGDAARTIHPLAGQGLNLGLQDAEALTARVADAMSVSLDPGSSRVLEAYGRDRRADQVAMAGTTDALNRLFSNDSGPARLLRDLGLGLVDRSPALKRWLTRAAAGRA